MLRIQQKRPIENIGDPNIGRMNHFNNSHNFILVV